MISRRGVLICFSILCAGIVIVGVGFATTDLTGGDDRPIAEAGLDQEVPQGTTVYLDAGGSQARSGTLVAYEWEIEAPDGTTTVPDCETCETATFTPRKLGVYEATVTVTDDAGRSASDTLLVTAFEYELPAVSLDGPDAVDVGEGASVDLTADAGETSLSAVTWLVDDSQRHAEFVDGQRVRLSLPVDTAEPGIRHVEAIVVDDNGYATRATHDLAVLADGPHFDVTITNTSDPVTAGDRLDVDTTIVNTGTEAGTRHVLLETLDGSPLAVAQDVSLGPREQTDRTLTWLTNPGDEHVDAVRVRTIDDADTAPVTIFPTRGNATIQIEALESPSEVVAGDAVPVTATVRNAGNVTANELLVLHSIHGNPVAFERVALEPDEHLETTLTWETDSTDAGYGALSVHSRDDFARDPLRVLEPAFFDVSITGTDRDDDLDVTVEVTNTGGAQDTQQIRLGERGSSSVEDHTTVSLSSSESTTLTLRWDDFDLETSGSVTVEVASDDDSETTVESSPCRSSDCVYPYFDVSVVLPDEIESGDFESLTATVIKWPNDGESGKGQGIEDAQRELMSPAMWAAGDGSPLAWQAGYTYASEGYAIVTTTGSGFSGIHARDPGPTEVCLADETTENHGPGGRWGTCYETVITDDESGEHEDPLPTD